VGLNGADEEFPGSETRDFFKIRHREGLMTKFAELSKPEKLVFVLGFSIHGRLSPSVPKTLSYPGDKLRRRRQIRRTLPWR